MQAQFDQLGFQTLLPTLCGHGTQPEAMLQCTYRDWLCDAETALNALRRQCKTVFVVGLSMGGALSLYLAAHHDFAGVVTMAAPVRLSPVKEVAARWLHPVIRWQIKKNGPDIRDQAAKKRLRSYYRYPTRAAVELFNLLRLVRGHLSRIRMPILIIHSKQDHAVPYTNAVRIYRSVASAQKRLKLFTESYHIISADVEKEQVFKEIQEFIQEILEGEK